MVSLASPPTPRARPAAHREREGRGAGHAHLAGEGHVPLLSVLDQLRARLARGVHLRTYVCVCHDVSDSGASPASACEGESWATSTSIARS